MIRIGIIGLGWWGKQIVTCLTGSPRFEVVAGCDIDTAMAAPFAASHKFELTDRYETLLQRADLDAVAVTPHALHEEMAIAVLAAGKQLFCEKPLALTTASAERMACAAASPACRRRRFMGGLHACWRPGLGRGAGRRNVDKGIPSSFVHCRTDGSRETRSYHDANTVRMNFEAWADAIEGRAPYRFSTEHLLGNIRILDAVTRAAAADGKPIAL